MDWMDQYRKLGLNTYQLHQIQLGFQHGLTADQVNLYATNEYDSMQMKEIRLGYETGLSEEQIRSYANPEIEASAMNHMRISIDRNEKISDIRQVEYRQKKWKLRLIVIAVLFIGSSIIAGGYYLQDEIRLYTQVLDLTLTSSDTDIEYGSDFNPLDYVQSYSKDPNVELILPDGFTANTLGETKVLYKLKNEKKVITKELVLHVVDTVKPVLSLTTDFVTLTRGVDYFKGAEYIADASDNVDGNLMDSVQISDFQSDPEQQIIHYSVSDSSGNEVQAELTLYLIDPVVEQIPIYEPVINPVVIPDPPSENPLKGTFKNYWFTDGYDIDSAFAACQADGNAYGGSYACDPIIADSIYVGYQLSYR